MACHLGVGNRILAKMLDTSLNASVDLANTGKNTHPH